jgi:hypothetical protein
VERIIIVFPFTQNKKQFPFAAILINGIVIKYLFGDIQKTEVLNQQNVVMPVPNL